VLPSVLVAAGAYLAVTLLTDASLLVRIGILAFLAGVVPIVLNRILGGGSTNDWRDEPTEGIETATATPTSRARRDPAAIDIYAIGDTLGHTL